MFKIAKLYQVLLVAQIPSNVFATRIWLGSHLWWLEEWNWAFVILVFFSSIFIFCVSNEENTLPIYVKLKPKLNCDKVSK